MAFGWSSNQHLTNFNTFVDLRLRYLRWWVQVSRWQLFPVTVQNMDLILSYWTRTRSRARLESPDIQTQQHEDKGRRNGPTFRHFKWLTHWLCSYVANSLNWPVQELFQLPRMFHAMSCHSHEHRLGVNIAIISDSRFPTWERHPSTDFSRPSQCLEFLPLQSGHPPGVVSINAKMIWSETHTTPV